MEDERKGDSNSTQNQRMTLEAYAKENGFTNPKFLYDGHSGTGFDGPGWNEAVKLMEAGQIRHSLSVTTAGWGETLAISRKRWIS